MLRHRWVSEVEIIAFNDAVLDLPGGETFVQMNGAEKTLRPGDMMMSDGDGVVCTVLYGQDRRTPISPASRRALYVAYAPAGVPAEAVAEQLETTRDNIALFAPEAEVELLEVYAAGSANRPGG